MSPKEIIVLSEADKELRDFLERTAASGSVRVQAGDATYIVKVSNEQVSHIGRAFLTKNRITD
ncbi:hypothetical protein HFO02_34050 [Rhizobium laguerreae]|uniref:hypothetical protein n=1 Tax=Rhizobium laguerreae TaxID=1076926 RepID=UPI001C91F48D|nr:hypothetical protein [Rhizobium laguerreae]MBY3328524.1 hypothetical protein [Rhizobium laguerreae]